MAEGPSGQELNRRIILAKGSTICSREYRSREYCFGGAPYGATTDLREGCAEMGAVTRATVATGAVGGAPYGAMILVRGVPK